VLRFLSALSFATAKPVDLLGGGGGAPVSKGQPFYRHPRRLPPLVTHEVNTALPPDDNAEMAIGFWREGHAERSPFYGFLAFWKCLEVVLGDDPQTIAGWIERHAEPDEAGLGVEMVDRAATSSHMAREPAEVESLLILTILTSDCGSGSASLWIVSPRTNPFLLSSCPRLATFSRPIPPNPNRR
jgi:hypothetical protein